MKKIWDRIKLALQRLLISTWYIWIGAIVGAIIGLIYYKAFDWNMVFFGMFGAVLGVALYVAGRSLWWYISGTGDYIGREGLLKRLWLLIFKK